jgi:hypothetical protein
MRPQGVKLRRIEPALRSNKQRGGRLDSCHFPFCNALGRNDQPASRRPCR